MGAPSSSIISEIFLQNIEHTHLPGLAEKHKLVNYFRFVDDILIIYDSQHTNINAILSDFNSIHPKIQYTEETEQNNTINYLDITIHKKLTNVSISIFRKPTYTGTLIPYTSNHPLQQKYAAIRFLYDRLNSYHLQGKEYRLEENIIHNILHNNFYPILPQKPNHNHGSQSQNSQNKQKWCTFTYIGKETTYITKIFKHSNIKVADRTNNTLQKHLTHSIQNHDKFTRSSVYKLTCPDCGKAYAGQTGRDFYTRYNEHKRSFRYNNHNSKYAQHLTEHGHTFGSIHNIMQVLQVQKKRYSPQYNRKVSYPQRSSPK
jgi:hypothetical protein